MPIMLGGYFSPAIVIPWTLIGEKYVAYLSASADSFVVTLKDNINPDGSWGRISFFAYDKKGQAISSDAINTILDSDWRKSLTHSSAKTPPKDSDPCIDTYRFYGLATVQEVSAQKFLYQFNPQQKVNDTQAYQDVMGIQDTMCLITEAPLDSSGTVCNVGETRTIESVAVQSLGTQEAIILGIAAVNWS